MKHRLFHEDGRLRRSEVIAIGAAFGWPPRVTEEQTLWELIAYVDGHNRANGGDDKVEPPSDDEFEEMLRKHNLPATVN